MPKFAYKAINQAGTQVSGVIDADSAGTAGMLLSNQGLIPTKVEEDKPRRSGSVLHEIKLRLGGVKEEEIILMTKQFRTMLVSGLSIVQLIDILQNQTQNPRLRNVLAQISTDIRAGNSLTEAFRRHEKVLSPLYVNMVNAGEQSGTLPDVLQRLVYILEHEYKVKSDISGALLYPKIVLVALAIAFTVLLTFVMPTFIGVFASAGLDLPLPTKLALGLYGFLKKFWYAVLIVLVGGIAGYRWYVNTPAGKYIRDSLLLKIPILGTLFQKAAMSRFASIFSILQASGIPVLVSMDILVGTIGNEAIAREFRRIRSLLGEGRGISSPLRSAKYFTPMVVDMVAVGEETGALDDMLQQVSMHYDDEVAYAASKLSQAVGPILVVSLAVVVGFFALAIFLPMWDLTKMVR
ncbi:MAG: type II secretion system F family protein [Syntrophales bacterium]|jgi:type IV pilus assembly protein PilC|nr:type II secretion system F family protein [Syntrophales bacterium]MCK9528582.1 type II secretion system F family protein [Syntrophales bacterium]MDX9922781.1 type II secretion system F family protein [Syntrophales bacterium]